MFHTTDSSRSREGAWIEMSMVWTKNKRVDVAPVRERGLKYAGRGNPHPRASRSREGAWIEIRNTVGFSVLLTQMTYSD